MERVVSRNRLKDTRTFVENPARRFLREITSLVCPRQCRDIVAPCLSTGQGQSKGEGTSLDPPPPSPVPPSLSLEAPSTKRVRLFSRFCRDSSAPFVRFQCLAFELDSSFPAFPRMSLPPKPREEISGRGNCGR